MVLLFVVCGWWEEAVAGVFQRNLVHSTYVFLVTRATKVGKIVNPAVVWVLSGLVLCTAPTDLNDRQFRVILTEDVETGSSFLDPMEETPQLLLY
jgi:hypothetical protein